MKKMMSLVLSFVFVICFFCNDTNVMAAGDSYSGEKIVFEDGSYFIMSISEETQYNVSRAVSTKTGTKTGRYYNASNELQFSVIVSGTFTYNGTTATATDSHCSYSITNTSWSFVSGHSYAEEDIAVATCTFRLNLAGNKTYSVILRCSPTGVLS